MSEQKSRFLPMDGSALAPLAQAEWPAFVVEALTGRLVAANAASVQAGLAEGAQAPASLRALARRIAAQGAMAQGLMAQDVAAREAATQDIPDERDNLADTLPLTALTCRLLDSAGVHMVLFYDPRAIRAGDAVDEGREVPQHSGQEPTGPAPSGLTATSPAPPVAPPPGGDTPVARPVRFTWETDADGRLQLLSDSFVRALAGRLGAWRGRSFAQLAADGALRADADLAAAVARGETFSDVAALTNEAAPRRIVFGAAPRRDALGRVVGMRGFGLIWPSAAEAAIDGAPASALPAGPRDLRQGAQEGPAPAAANVVALRGGSLNANERSAFHEIARTLNQAIGSWPAKGEGEVEAAPPPSPASPGQFREVRPAPPILPPVPASPLAAVQEDTLLDRLPVGVLVEQRGIVVRVNRTLLGWTGSSDMAAFLRVGGLDAHLIRGADGDGLYVAAPDGAHTPVELRIIAAPWNGAAARVCMLRNLTGAVAAPAVAGVPLAQPARRSGLAGDRLPFALFLLDRTGRIVEANAAAERLSGFPREALRGEPAALLFAPGTRAEAHGLLERAAAGGEHASTPLRARDREGRERAMEALAVRAEAVPDLVCLLLRPLPEPVSQPAPAIAEAPGPQQDARADLDGLARRVSHDLRDPLHGILGFIDAVHKAAFGPVGNVRYAKQAAMAVEAGHRLMALLEDIEGLVATHAPDAAPADLTAAVCEAATHLQTSMLRRRQLLRQDLAPDIIVRCARPALAHLVRLVLEEAIRATPVGGQVFLSSRIDASPGAPPVALLLVRDGGPALSEEEIAQVLDPCAPAPVADRMSAAGLPMRMARIALLARARGARFDLRRGLEGGMLSELRLPL